jgi:phosphatidylglycerophosphatase A
MVRFDMLNAIEFSIFMYVCGFILFRFFDILKPFHIGWVDKNVKGALGVMLDDIMAAIYASAALIVILLIYVMLWSPAR